MKNRKPKIALLIPRFSRGFRLESVPLNLSYLGAMLEQNSYFVKGFNLNFDQLTSRNIKQFDIFGISSPTAVFPETIKLAKKIKKANRQAFIVVGGPHPTACPQECLSFKVIDAVVMGEGEVPLLELVKRIEKKQNFVCVPNLVFRQGKKLRFNQKILIKDLDELSFPAKHLFDTSKYPDKQKAYGDIIASRGCPFKCTNCQPGLDHISPYRLRKQEKVVDEIEWLMKDYGVKHFTFSDSELVGPKGWVKKFTQELIKRKLRITYSCNGRTDQVDREILKKLKKSGCVFIGYGIESGSQKVIDELLKKGINLNRAKEVIKETVDEGIGVGAWFMIGIPGETREQVLKTIAYAQKIDASIIEVNIATPWPDTGFYELSKKKDWLVTDDWGKMNEKSFVAIETPYLSRQEVKRLFKLFGKELIKKSWKADSTATRFYHPHFIFRTAKSSLGAILHRGISKGD